MFVSFLMPHVDRGAGPLFHLIMLLQMSRFAPDEICFIGDDAYFAEEHVPFGEELALGTMRFTCVGQERFRAYRRAAVPFDTVAPLYADGRNHLDAFQALLTQPQPALTAALGAALDALAVAPDSIEAFLTWANCPSLSAFAVGLGKPVIHNELGPFRGPTYQDTVYFDFQGVNGNTTPATAWRDADALAVQLGGIQLLSAGELRSLLYRGAAPEAPTDADAGKGRYPLGVALQVEDDSNTLAYGRGYDAIRLLYQALRNLPPERVLVRSHPGARLGYRGGLGENDTSPSSLAFLQRIDRLLTINSSVAAEAALWGVPYTVLGDTPFALLSVPLEGPRSEGAAAATTDQGAAQPVPPEAEPAKPEAEPVQPEAEPVEHDSAPDPKLNALMLGYLVPGALLFDPDYYRWRLAGASLGECIERHLEILRRNALHVGEEAALPALAGRVASAPFGGADNPHRNPALWSATRSLSRSAAALENRVDELTAQLSAALAEREKNWEERCWFQTNLQRVEKEIEPISKERDTLRLALAKQQGEVDVLKHGMEAAREQAAAAQASVTLALKAQLAAADAFTVEAQALQARYDKMERALAAVQQRFDELTGELSQAHTRQATAEAQSRALLDELHRTQRERIDALARGVVLPPR